MTQMVTRCPKCATAFRITSTQLESAKGAVRCGSCLHIFKAQDFLVKSETSEAPKATSQATAITAEKIEAPKSETAKTETVKAEAPKIDIAKSTSVATPKVDKASNSLERKASEPSTAGTSAIVPKPVSPKAPEPEKITVVAKPVIDKAKALEDEDDTLISDDMDKVDQKASTYEFDGFLDIDLQPKQTVSLFEREIRYDELKDDNDESAADESWAEDLLDDDEETLHQLKKPAAPIPKEPEVDKYDEYSHQEEKAPEPSNSYAGPVFSLVSDDAKDPHETSDESVFSQEFLNATRAPETAKTETEAAGESSAFAASLFEQEPSDEDESESDKPASKRPVKSSSKMRAFDTSRAALLMNIMPAPVEFTAKRMRRWYQKKLWPTLAILMGALLFFQVAYFKFDYFSRVEPYRTAYLFICPVMGCEVPSLIDTSKILATNLIVRNHPDIESALMVDAILINNAPFEQPFPDLILSFSKLDETPVATRRFTPKEYLGGELAGMQYIPERQPVHITLEIADPGPDAVNYTLLTH